jgi:putative tryptophan/tyrosine transport system substrate-binding protein
MRRRDFVATLGGAATAPLWPRGALTQQAEKLHRIGFLGPALTSTPPISFFQAFLAELRQLGFVEGANLAVEHRPQDDPDRIFAAATELMRSRPELIVAAGGENALQAVVGASTAVPIVIIAVNYDPVERGYVSSLARPGGNITGVALRQIELAGKQVEILTQAFPDWKRMAILFDSQTANQFGVAEQAAKSLRMQVKPIKLENFPYDFEAAFREASASGAQTVLVLSSILFTRYALRIAELAVQHRLPAIFTNRLYAEAGGLMSYGIDFLSMYRKAADYVGRILKGAKPDDLPVELATKFETVVNLKTAKAIGVELPTAIMLRADKVIE